MLQIASRMEAGDLLDGLGQGVDQAAGRVGGLVNLRANTQATYRNLLRRYLLPTFGPMPLADLDAMAVRAWLASRRRTSRSPR
jgi:hypothetical protein